MAAVSGAEDVVELLLQQGAEKGETDDSGKTASDLAEDAGHGNLAARLRKQ
ncbi:MAG: hypothetical protein U5P41_07830 [Gammaproteobacteria bacterium]|nr:hypothetical protein [Gammaproteobacteria bacterium]